MGVGRGVTGENGNKYEIKQNLIFDSTFKTHRIAIHKEIEILREWDKVKKTSDIVC